MPFRQWWHHAPVCSGHLSWIMFLSFLSFLLSSRPIGSLNNLPPKSFWVRPRLIPHTADVFIQAVRMSYRHPWPLPHQHPYCCSLSPSWSTFHTWKPEHSEHSPENISQPCHPCHWSSCGFPWPHSSQSPHCSVQCPPGAQLRLLLWWCVPPTCDTWPLWPPVPPWHLLIVFLPGPLHLNKLHFPFKEFSLTPC